MRTVSMMDFPLDEYTSRISKLIDQMEVADVDGVMLTQEENLRYFCGLRSLVWKSHVSTPGILFVTRDGKMALVVSKSNRNTVEHTACVEEKEIIHYFNYGDSDGDKWVPQSHVEALAYAVQTLGLERGRIGIEAGTVSRMRISYGEFLALKEKTPKAKYVYFAQNIWNIRSVKSLREIELFRELCKISGKCFEKAFQSIEFGKTTERNVYEIFAQEAFRLGADAMPPLIVQFGQGRYIQLNCPPSDKVITKTEHDFLFVDTGPSKKGYITDTIRMGVVGSMTDQQKVLYDMVEESLDFCLNQLHDGASCLEISARLDNLVASRGLDDVHWTKRWLGHSVGLEVHELPTLSCECDMEIRSGMILSVEPMMLHKDLGMIAIEQNVLVTDTGYENLTPYLPELIIL